MDSCILVAYYYEFDTKNQHQQTIDCLEIIKANNKKISLVTSDFTFTEFVKALLQKEGINEGEIYKNLSHMNRQNKIGNKYSFKIIDAEGDETDYTFNDFFVGLQEILLNSKSHLADSIHAQIMKNNKINHILTFNTTDFSKISGIEAIHPNKVNNFVENIKE